MAKLTKILMLTILLALPAFSHAADELAMLQQLTSQPDSKQSTLQLKFSGEPQFTVTNSGQRIDIELQNTDTEPEFKLLRADEDIVNTHLVRDRGGITLSVLLRRIPAKVNSQRDPATGDILIDIQWEDLSVKRLGIVLDMPGRPRRSSAGTSLLRDERARTGYQGSWREFFSNYQTPLDLGFPLSVSLPRLPEEAAQLKLSLSEAQQQLFSEQNWSGILGEWDTNHRDDPEAEVPAAQQLLTALAASETGAMALTEDLLDFRQSNDKLPRTALRILLLAYLQAHAGHYHLALTTLEAPEQLIAEDDPLYAAALLLRGECQLAIGQINNARDNFSFLQTKFPGYRTELLSIRLADTLEAKESASAFATYVKAMTNDNAELWSLYSLNKFAMLALEHNEFQIGKRCYDAIAELVSLGDKHDLACYGTQYCRYMLGNELPALDELKRLSESAAGTEAGYRAEKKILEHWIPRLNFETALDWIKRFEPIYLHAGNLALREEASFKQALAYYLKGEMSSAIKRLDINLHEFGAGGLRPEVKTLLSELLPGYIDKLLNNDQVVKALALLERHRDLLLHARINRELLYRTANDYLQVGMPDKSLKIYLYLLDSTTTAAEESELLFHLGTISQSQDQLQQAVDYARRCLDGKPAPELRLQAIHLLAETSKALAGPQEAVKQLLHYAQKFEQPVQNLWAAELCRDAGEPAAALDFLKQIAPADQNDAVVLLTAECSLQVGDLANALEGFRQLQDNQQFGDQAKYRIAEIYLKNGMQDKALKQLETVVATAPDGIWKTLAAASLSETMSQL